MGRLTRDPEVRYTQSANPMAVAKYTLAIDRRVKKEGEQSADFINCTAFGKSGKFAQMYLHQGMRILVEGEWRTGSYVNRDGQKIYTNECHVSNQEFADGKESGNQPANPGRPQQNQSSIGYGFMNVPDGVEDEGLPFD